MEVQTEFPPSPGNAAVTDICAVCHLDIYLFFGLFRAHPALLLSIGGLRRQSSLRTLAVAIGSLRS